MTTTKCSILLTAECVLTQQWSNKPWPFYLRALYGWHSFLPFRKSGIVYCPFMKLKELLLPLMTVEKTWLMWLDSASDRPGTPFGTCGLFSHLSEHGVSYHTVFQAGHHLEKQKNTWVQLIFLRLCSAQRHLAWKIVTMMWKRRWISFYNECHLHQFIRFIFFGCNPKCNCKRKLN